MKGASKSTDVKAPHSMTLTLRDGWWRCLHVLLFLCWFFTVHVLHLFLSIICHIYIISFFFTNLPLISTLHCTHVAMTLCTCVFWHHGVLGLYWHEAILVMVRVHYCACVILTFGCASVILTFCCPCVTLTLCSVCFVLTCCICVILTLHCTCVLLIFGCTLLLLILHYTCVTLALHCSCVILTLRTVLLLAHDTGQEGCRGSI
jgi:hypothetical protein